MEKLLSFLNTENEKIIIFYEDETYYIFNATEKELIFEWKNDFKNTYYYIMEYIDVNIHDKLIMDIEDYQKEMYLDTIVESELYGRYPTLFKALIKN